MRSFKRLFLVSISVIVTFFVCIDLVQASNCPSSDYDCQIAEIQREIDALSPAHENNKQELADLRAQFANLKKKIVSISNQMDELDADISAREKDLAFTREVFEEKAQNHYRFIRTYDPLMPFVISDSASQAFREIVFRQQAADGDRQTMEAYAQELVTLRDDKKTLEETRSSLAALQAQVDSRATFLAGEVAKVEDYIESLSARQEELLALKAGGFSTSIGDTPATLEPCSGPPDSSNFCDPGFRSAYAVFSFGAPHRTGMSQYGALGRSRSGQSAEQILGAYYQGAELVKGYGAPNNITVTGYGSISFEENYLLGIYEVPESWGDTGGFEALKAQAVAARSYALSVTNNGASTICPTESCQVYKPQLKSGKWAEAVRATRGWVMTRGGAVTTTYFASTSGGYTISQWGWSGIKDAAGSWPDTAYEKVGGSPWFYKGWHKSRGGQTCGRTHPWLTGSEMADIINSWHVLYRGGGDASRISPLDTGCWGGHPYSVSELVSIGGYSSVSSSSVIYSDNGSTISVSFSTNKGGVTISGEEFKRAFNLRAPGYVGLKSSLFNVESL